MCVGDPGNVSVNVGFTVSLLMSVSPCLCYMFHRVSVNASFTLSTLMSASSCLDAGRSSLPCLGPLGALLQCLVLYRLRGIMI